MGQVKLSIDKQTGGIELEGFDYPGDGCVKDIDEITKILRMETIFDTDKVQETITVVKGFRR